MHDVLTLVITLTLIVSYRICIMNKASTRIQALTKTFLPSASLILLQFLPVFDHETVPHPHASTLDRLGTASPSNIALLLNSPYALPIEYH